MKTSLSRFLFTACLGLLPASLIHATPDAAMQVSLTGYFQAAVSSSNTLIRGNVGKTRISTKQLLKLISQDSGRSIPSGSQLIVTDSGSTEVVDRQGATILDSTPYVRVKFFKDAEIIDGVRNLTTGKEKTRAYFKLALSLNLTGLTGTVNGIAIEQNDVSEPSRDGVQTSRVITDSRVNGRGSIQGGSSFYDGTISLKGRAAAIR